MKKIIQIIIFSGILVLPALSYFSDYHDLNDNSNYGDHGWIMEQQAQQSLEQERLKDQMQMHDLENEEHQTQTFENQENIIQKIRGAEIESQDSYDPVCPYGGCV